jgi:DNA recombination protein RmuC
MDTDVVGYVLAVVISGGAGLLIGALLAWIVRGRVGRRQVGPETRDAFHALATEAFKDNAEMFLDRTKVELEPLNSSLEKLDQRIRELEEKREGAYQGLQEQLRQLAQTESTLQQTTHTLSQALRSSTAQGQWGELQLHRVVELAGMVEHVDFEEQVGGQDGRPDMLVRLPNGGILPVDAKTPMSAYLDALSSEEPKGRQEKLAAHCQAMKGRIRNLSGKQYWDQFTETPQFVVMFVPNEACLSAAFRLDGGLLDYALEARVLIASPVTLLALLKAVGYGWQQVTIAENARQIAEEGRMLYSRIGVLMEHIASLGTHIGRSVDAYNDLVGSLEHRLLPSARRFVDLGVGTDALPGAEGVDQAPRRLTAEELEDDGDS